MRPRAVGTGNQSERASVRVLFCWIPATAKDIKRPRASMTERHLMPKPMTGAKKGLLIPSALLNKERKGGRRGPLDGDGDGERQFVGQPAAAFKREPKSKNQ